MALDVYIPVYQKDKNILKRADNTNTELNRLKNLSSGQDLSPDYLDVYNATINAQPIDIAIDRQKPASVKKSSESDSDLINQNAYFRDPGITAGYQGTSPGSTANTGSNQDKLPTSNVLHDYAPYNYVITLSCLDKNHFNEGREGDGLVIARGGGKGTTGPGPLSRDFYIDNLVIRNTISPSTAGGLGAVYQVIFEVTEPYGVSFIDALIQAADAQGYTNHLVAAFKLRIEFKGVDDEGKQTNTIPFSTREIPINIVAAEMSIQAGVSTYQVTAMPCTNLAFTELHGRTKESYTTNGKTIGEVIDDLFQQINNTQQTLVDQNKVKLPDEYALEFAQSKDILKTEIGYDAKSDSKNMKLYDVSYVKGNLINRGIVIQKGVDIQSWIESLIRESVYYRQQFDDAMNPLNDRLKIPRIYPQLEILADDNGNNRPQYRFKYVIREQEVTAAYFLKQAQDLTKDIIPSRVYNYLYTGKNQDVLNFDISYKFAFYQPIPYTENTTNSPQTDNFDGQIDEVGDNDQTGGGNKGQSQVVKEAQQSKHDNGMTLSVNKKNGEIGRIFEQVISDPAADMLVTTLEIIGDPYWIAQKEVSNRSFTLSHQEGNPNTDEQGAVATDESEVLVELNFKTPQDLDDESGLFLNSERVSFSGKYKVFICANRFAGGMFTNELEMVRMKFQEDDIPTSVDVSGSSKGGMQAKQGNSYNTERPAFLTDMKGTGSAGAVDGDNTDQNVTKVPVGSNISRKGSDSRYVYQDEFDSYALPTPKIDIEPIGDRPKPSAEQQALIDEIARMDSQKQSRLTNGN